MKKSAFSGEKTPHLEWTKSQVASPRATRNATPCNKAEPLSSSPSLVYHSPDHTTQHVCVCVCVFGFFWVLYCSMLVSYDTVWLGRQLCLPVHSI